MLKKILMFLVVIIFASSAAYASSVDLPKTGQTTSYATGDDGHLQKGVEWPTPRFTVSGDCITDNLTGLMWVKSPDNTVRTWANALSYANGLTLCGYSDWRLPNINELKSLMNAGVADSSAWLNTQGFSISNANYWSSTTSKSIGTSWAWVIQTGSGWMDLGPKTNSYRVLPVRGQSNLPKTGQTTSYATGDDGHLQMGIEWANPRFITDDEFDCVIDTLTGLMWVKSPDNTTGRTWNEALTYANNLNLCGYTDWRLPNKNELRSLFNYEESYGAAWLNSQGFANVQPNLYWTSTTYAANSNMAWYVNMYSGSAYPYNKSASYYVLAVRGGEPDIYAEPMSYDFGSITVGGSSSSKEFKITNIGTKNLSITEVELAGENADQFAKINDNCSNQVLEFFEECTIHITFAPSSAGEKNATLNIPSNDPDTPNLQISLSGYGIPMHTLTVTKAGTGTGTVTAGDNCTLNWSDNTGTCTVNDGTSIVLSGIADTGSTFAGWSGGTGSAITCTGAGSCTFNITQNSAVTATFNLTQLQYTLTVTKSGTGSGTVTSSPSGINCGSTCTALFDSDTSATLTATTATGSTFAGWSGDCSGTNATVTVTMNANKSCTAEFRLSSLPSSPTSLTATATSSTRIVLTWKDNSDNETGFRIQRKVGACDSTNPWTNIATKTANITTHTNIGLSPETTYSYRVSAYNAYGNSAWSNCSSAKTAKTGTPASPSNLIATSTSASSIKLTWKNNATNATRLEIYRKAGTGARTLLTTINTPIATTYSDTGAIGNADTITYSYDIQACNTSGCSPTTAVAVVPYRPINLQATAGAGKVDITWTDNSTNETGFQIQRKTGTCTSTSTWSLIHTTGENVTSYSDTELTSGTYSYRIMSFTRSVAAPYAHGYSGWSNCVSGTVQ